MSSEEARRLAEDEMYGPMEQDAREAAWAAAQNGRPLQLPATLASALWNSILEDVRQAIAAKDERDSLAAALSDEVARREQAEKERDEAFMLGAKNENRLLKPFTDALEARAEAAEGQVRELREALRRARAVAISVANRHSMHHPEYEALTELAWEVIDPALARSDEAGE